MRVRVLAFARVRELLGGGSHDLTLPEAATAGDAWTAIACRHAELAALAGSTRMARNGRLVGTQETLHEGDELALLPPVGGG